MKLAMNMLALAVAATAHYTFDRLQVNGEVQGDSWQYVREHTRGYMPTKGQQILEDDFRCQPGGASGANTDVYTVKGGDTVKLLGAFGMTSIEHPGPAQVYMSKAPSNEVKSYDGSGDWFKVREAYVYPCASPETIANHFTRYLSTLCTPVAGNDDILTTAWCTWGQDGIEFVVPSRLPDGEYLTRVEHIPLHGAQGSSTGAEYYYSCAQLKIEGNTGKTWLPTRTAKIPGMIQPGDDGVIYNIWDSSITEYPYAPGSKLIVGGTAWGSKDGNSDGIVKSVAKRAARWVGSAAARARELMDS
ncbi:hypothetical protein LTR56_009929 [Elasticomyces elasticus]|nr:hypothetical protein LTR56_009929 [Elasticomyces elasticus]KAK3660211.1 hypothetical protein LTR22_008036 [Elasticomyces elasticus]KAK4933717.1 hypothetical protein LTR49_000182 [Elasticomyces elasticus]KAK5761593.1 hypothetical protein LTS12_008197 [Elasticomyces elasticus]